MSSVCMLSVLRYLNLSWINISSLSKVLGRIMKRKQLDLGNNFRLEHFSPEAISDIKSLQSLNMPRGQLCWMKDGYGYQQISARAMVGLTDIESLQQLVELETKIKTPLSSQIFMGSLRLMKSTRYLYLENQDDLTTKMTFCTSLSIGTVY